MVQSDRDRISIRQPTRLVDRWVVVRHPDGRLEGAADPRSDGAVTAS